MLPYILIAIFLLAALVLALVGHNKTDALPYYIFAGMAILLAVTTFIFRDSLTVPTPTEVIATTPATVTTIPPTYTPTWVPSSTPLIPSTFTPAPTFTAVPATPTEIAFTGLVINQCPKKSLGTHPDTGQPLEFSMNPYPTDPEVLCIFEAYSTSEDIMIIVPSGGADIAADWLHGYQWNLEGELIDECQEKDKIAAPECEGTWVAIRNFVIPKGNLVKLYVYAHEGPARVRFTHTTQWFKPFACEYIGHTFLTDDGRTIVHNEDSIRVPAWATGMGTIYEFNRTLSNPIHCPDGIIAP